MKIKTSKSNRFGQTIVSCVGNLTFDQNGVCEKELTDEQVEELLSLDASISIDGEYNQLMSQTPPPPPAANQDDGGSKVIDDSSKQEQNQQSDQAEKTQESQSIQQQSQDSADVKKEGDDHTDAVKTDDQSKQTTPAPEFDLDSIRPMTAEQFKTQFTVAEMKRLAKFMGLSGYTTKSQDQLTDMILGHFVSPPVLEDMEIEELKNVAREAQLPEDEWASIEDANELSAYIRRQMGSGE